MRIAVNFLSEAAYVRKSQTTPCTAARTPQFCCPGQEAGSSAPLGSQGSSHAQQTAVKTARALLRRGRLARQRSLKPSAALTPLRRLLGVLTRLGALTRLATCMQGQHESTCCRWQQSRQSTLCDWRAGCSPEAVCSLGPLAPPAGGLNAARYPHTGCYLHLTSAMVNALQPAGPHTSSGDFTRAKHMVSISKAPPCAGWLGSHQKTPAGLRPNRRPEPLSAAPAAHTFGTTVLDTDRAGLPRAGWLGSCQRTLAGWRAGRSPAPDLSAARAILNMLHARADTGRLALCWLAGKPLAPQQAEGIESQVSEQLRLS